MRMIIILMGLISTLILAENSNATTVKPLAGGKPSSVPVLSDPAPGGTRGILVETSCYGTNNRHTSNPLSPKSTIFMVVRAGKKGSYSGGYIVKFPANLAKLESEANPDSIGTGNTGCGYRKLNAAEANKSYSDLKKDIFRDATKFTKSAVYCGVNHLHVNVNKLGIPEADKNNINVISYQDFGNDNIKKEQYYGGNGSLDQGTKTKVTYKDRKDDFGNDDELLHIVTDYPGQDGYCGGYHSPLMLFFDNKRPRFKGSSSLLAKGKNQKTFWVEKNHAGYFLARLDSKNKANGITDADQLFGDNGRDKDGKRLGGFTRLAEFDSNQDGKISAKDDVWKNLVLWKDKNGDGKSQKGELTSLSAMRVKSINLKHDASYRYNYGKRASSWGKGTFNYGKGKKGVVVDIYFNER